MSRDRAAVSTDGLVKILLVLVVIWLALEVLGEVLQVLMAPFSGLSPIIGVVVLVLLLLWLTDNI